MLGMTSSFLLGSFPPAGGKLLPWSIFRVALSLRGSSARVHCRMTPSTRVARVGVRIRLYGQGLRFVSVVPVLVFIAV